MQTFTTRTLGLFLIGILGGTVACSDAMGPDAADPPPSASTYNLDVTTRYIEVEGTCDKDIFGDQVAGEFQYRIEVREGEYFPI